MSEPERQQQPYTYNGLYQIIKETLPGNSSEKPGYAVQFGGKFDGKERAFVVPTWGRSLMTPDSSKKLMEEGKKLLDEKYNDLDIVVHPMRDSHYILIVQSK